MNLLPTRRCATPESSRQTGGLKPALRLAVLHLACALALIGCAPGAYGSTRPLIKIGLAAPFEGLERPLGYEALQGVKLALAQRNAAGGVAGAMVELVALNDSARPDEARLQAREFAADPAVLGVITGWSGDMAAAALPIYRQEGIAVVVPWSVPGELGDPTAGVVLLAADSRSIARALARLLTAASRRQVAVVGETAAVQPYLDLLGPQAKWVAPPDAPDADAMRAWVARLVLARPPPPEALILVTNGVQAGGILQALRETSWPGPVFGGAEAGSVQLVDVAGPAADGIIFASPAPADCRFRIADCPQTFRKSAISNQQSAIPNKGVESAGLPLGELGPRALLAYDATEVLLSAIESAIQTDGQLTRAGVVRAMPAVRVRGLTGDIAFGEDGRRLGARVWVYQIEANRYPGRLVE